MQERNGYLSEGLGSQAKARAGGSGPAPKIPGRRQGEAQTSATGGWETSSERDGDSTGVLQEGGEAGNAGAAALGGRGA